MNRKIETAIAYAVLIFLILSAIILVQALLNAFYIPPLPDDFYYFKEKYDVRVHIQEKFEDGRVKEYAQAHDINSSMVKGYNSVSKTNADIFALNLSFKNDLLMHEMGHIVWNRALSEEEKIEYSRIYKETRSRINIISVPWKVVDNPEENFAESFKCYYSKFRLCYLTLSKEQKEFLAEMVAKARA